MGRACCGTASNMLQPWVGKGGSALNAPAADPQDVANGEAALCLMQTSC